MAGGAGGVPPPPPPSSGISMGIPPSSRPAAYSGAGRSRARLARTPAVARMFAPTIGFMTGTSPRHQAGNPVSDPKVLERKHRIVDAKRLDPDAGPEGRLAARRSDAKEK